MFFFTYDSVKKGPLYNLTQENIFPVTLFANFQYYFLSSYAITSITVSNDQASVIYTSQNTFDNDGFLKSTTLKSENDELFKVEYNYIEKK